MEWIVARNVAKTHGLRSPECGAHMPLDFIYEAGEDRDEFPPHR